MARYTSVSVQSTYESVRPWSVSENGHNSSIVGYNLIIFRTAEFAMCCFSLSDVKSVKILNWPQVLNHVGHVDKISIYNNIDKIYPKHCQMILFNRGIAEVKSIFCTQS